MTTDIVYPSCTWKSSRNNTIVCCVWQSHSSLATVLEEHLYPQALVAWCNVAIILYGRLSAACKLVLWHAFDDSASYCNSYIYNNAIILLPDLDTIWWTHDRPQSHNDHKVKNGYCLESHKHDIIIVLSPVSSMYEIDNSCNFLCIHACVCICFVMAYSNQSLKTS